MMELLHLEMDVVVSCRVCISWLQAVRFRVPGFVLLVKA